MFPEQRWVPGCEGAVQYGTLQPLLQARLVAHLHVPDYAGGKHSTGARHQSCRKPGMLESGIQQGGIFAGNFLVICAKYLSIPERTRKFLQDCRTQLKHIELIFK